MLKRIFIGLIPLIISRVDGLNSLPESLKRLIKRLLLILSQLLYYPADRIGEFWRKERYLIASAAVDFLRDFLNENGVDKTAENHTIQIQLNELLTRNPNIQ